MKIGFIGLGFVGLSTAAAFASKDIKVFGYDNDSKKLELISRGLVPFYEPSLQDLLKKSISSGFFKICYSLEELILQTDAVFIAVGTPSNNDGSINLSYVFGAAESIAEAIRKTRHAPTIVVKSTVTPGTAKQIKQLIIASAGEDHISVCSNPEFLREGSAVQDTLNPHLVVIGCDDDFGQATLLKAFYEGLYSEKKIPIMITTTSTAEMIKYTNNAFLATKISFINTIANICQRIEGCDVETVAQAIGMDPRIGPLFLRAGAGYGGSCFPKDVKALISFSESRRYNPLILSSVDTTNRLQPFEVTALVEKIFRNISRIKIAVLGLAFKKDTDDLREAVSIPIVNTLIDREAIVRVYDPKAMTNAKGIFGARVTFCNSALECISGTECCIILTDWEEFKQLRPEDFKKNMSRPIVIDSRRVFDAPKFEKVVEFHAIGRGQPKAQNKNL